MSKKIQNKKTLYDDLFGSMDELRKELLEHQYPEDLMHEIVDRCIPVYHSELLDLVGNEHKEFVA